MTHKSYTPVDHLIKPGATVGASKEFEGTKPTVPPALEYQKVKEFVPDREVAPYISVREEHPVISEDLKKQGVIDPSGTQFPTYENVKVPLSDEKILTGLHAPLYSSLRWLATLAFYILKKAHLTIKMIHGSILRVRV
ncbi:MAG TPA: hypothetical protein VJH96_04515 [Patescibacteria group bacterium]|nr:hypothetical protein [Patescibacteria group bacterium]